MLGLWKNELRFFFSRRNLLVFLAVLLAVPFVFYASLCKSAENWEAETSESILKQSEYAQIYINNYENKIAYYEVKEPESEKLSDMKEVLQLWKTYNAENNLLADYWQNPDKWEDEIRTLTRQTDELLSDASDLSEEEEYALYRQTKRDWNQRMLLHNAYEESGTDEPLNPAEPTGAYALYQTLSGYHLIFLLLIVLIVCWNYDCWSMEFDAGTYRLFYIQPYSRRCLFWVRSLTHWLFSMLGCLLVLGEVYLCGAIRYGSGWSDYVIENNEILKTFGTILSQDNLMQSDVVLSMAQAVLLRFGLACLFLTFCYLVVQFFSFLCKSGMLSVICTFALAIFVFSTNIAGQGEAQSLLPLYYYRIDSLLTGDMQIGVPCYLLIETISAAVIWVGTRIWMEHRNL